MSKGNTRLGKWLSFLLMFVFICTSSIVILPQKAEAKTVKKRVSGCAHTVTLYDDGTVELTGKNGFGECNITRTTGAIDVAAGYLCSMVLYADGTVEGAGHFTNVGDYECRYSGNEPEHIYERPGWQPNWVGANCGANYFNPSPNANIVAIAMMDKTCGVMYADGTIKMLAYRYDTWGYSGWNTLGSASGAVAFRVCAAWSTSQTSNRAHGAQVLMSDGSTKNYLVLGSPSGKGDRYSGYIFDRPKSPWGFCHELNKDPIIEFTGLPDGLKVYKAETSLNFSVKVTAPDGDQNLTTEFYLDIGRGFKKVNGFTANGTLINNGQLSARNGTEYAIKIDKTADLIPPTIDSFRLKAIARTSGNNEGENVVTLEHFGQPPVIEFLDLINGQKSRKSNNNLEFKLKVSHPDSANKNIETEIFMVVFSTDYKVNEFTVNGILNTEGKLLAQNGAVYTISLNKGVYVPLYANDFKLKVVAKDAVNGDGVKELSFVHYTDILAQWALDSVKEKVVIDFSGQGNNGVVYKADLVTGIIGNALGFDGANDYVSIPKANFNNLSNWTFEAWVKPKGPGYIYTEGNPWETMILEVTGNNGLKISTWHGSRTGNWDHYMTKANVLMRGKWNHLVVTLNNGGAAKNSGTVNCFVNGNLVATGKLGSESNTAAKEAFIGGNVGFKVGQQLNSFKGCIDEVTLYGCTLTAEEVKRNYQNMAFLKNVKITNQNNEETSAPCTFGVHMNKLEFDLTKTVNELALELDLPSNIKVASIGKFFKEGVQVENPVVTVDNNKIFLKQPLIAGHYKIEFILDIDDQLIVKTRSYNDEKGIKINHESEKFEFEFLDFGSLPDVL